METLQGQTFQLFGFLAFFAVLLNVNTVFCQEAEDLLAVTNTILVLGALSSALVLAFPQYSKHIRFFDWIIATPLFLSVFRIFGNRQLVRQENLLITAGVALSVLSIAYRYLPFVDPSFQNSGIRSTIGGIVVALLAYILYEVAFLVKELEGDTNFDALFFLFAVWLSGGLYYIYTEQEPTSQLLYLLIKIAFVLGCG
jgi:hypothetical protein